MSNEPQKRSDRLKARNKIKREQSCKHYRGTCEATCAVGVNLRELAGGPDLGWATRLPCNPFLGEDDPAAIVQCDKKELPTAEEVAAEEAAMEKHMQQFMLTLPLIARVKAEHKDESWKGVEVCPVCGGRLHMTHAACNGHVWGKCETENCLAWME